MLSNVLVLVHGPEVDHSTNRLYLNKQIQLKGFGTRDFVFENKLEGRHHTQPNNLRRSVVLTYIFTGSYLSSLRLEP